MSMSALLCNDLRWHTCCKAYLYRPGLTPYSLKKSKNFVALTRPSPSNYKESLTGQDIWEEDALSHNSGLQLLFLGTGTGHPAEQR